VLSVFAAYELLDNVIESIRNPIALHKFNENGDVQWKTITSAHGILFEEISKCFLDKLSWKSSNAPF